MEAVNVHSNLASQLISYVTMGKILDFSTDWYLHL